MPSTYTTNLGIEKIATGEQSGTWGDTTNTNFDLIDQAVNGVEQITLAAAGSSGSPNDLPITDGTSSGGRNKFIEFVDGGDLGGTAFVQLTPNDAEKIVFIRNSLSADRTITIFQGIYNASNDFVIPNGADVVLKFDGAGTGATVTDVYVNLTPTKITTATADVTTVNATTVDSTNVEVTNIKAKDGTASATIADTTGVMTIASSVLTTADINGGTMDDVTIGGATPADGTFATLVTTDVDSDLIPASDNAYDLGASGTEWKDLYIDGTANIDSLVADTADIDGGSVDGATLGTTTPITEAQVDNINIDGNAITSTDSNGDIEITPDGTGKVGIGTSSPTELLTVDGDMTVAEESSYKTTTQNLPSIKPSLNLDFANMKKLDPRITFTRTTTATYYDGVTHEKAEENLLIRSQEFDVSGTWPQTNATVSANTGDTTAPDGTSTAEKITDDATNSVHRIEQITTSIITANTTYSASIFAKKGTHDFLLLTIGDASTGERYFCAVFDLDAGTVSQTANGTSGTLTSSSISSVGNGWYRCVLVGSLDAVTSTRFKVMFAPAASGNTVNTFGQINYAGTGTDFYIWGAQLEQRSSVTAYTPTTDQPITNYIPALQTAASGEARFDHNPTTGESLGLLIEEQRTNLFDYSAEFDDASWTKVRSSITADTIVAPDGTLTGDKLVANTDNNTHAVSDTVSGTTNSSPITLSIFAKAGEYSGMQLRIQSSPTGTTFTDCRFDLVAGTAGTPTNNGTSASSSATITPVGNGWYRCTLTTTLTNAETSVTGYSFVGINGTTFSYTGDGFSGIYIWGAQLEEASFPTSYIATSGSQVTRNADTAVMTGDNFSSWYRADEGGAYLEASIFSTFSAGEFISFSDDSGNNRWDFMAHGSSGSELSNGRYRIVINGSTTDDALITFDRNQFYKFAGSLNLGDKSNSIDGGVVGVNTQYLIPQNLSKLEIMDKISGHVKKIGYYPLKLTDQELQALTEE